MNSVCEQSLPVLRGPLRRTAWSRLASVGTPRTSRVSRDGTDVKEDDPESSSDLICVLTVRGDGGAVERETPCPRCTNPESVTRDRHTLTEGREPLSDHVHPPSRESRRTRFVGPVLTVGLGRDSMVRFGV